MWKKRIHKTICRYFSRVTCYWVTRLFFYLSLQNLFFLLHIIVILLLLSRHLWEWASTLPGCISPPSGVAGVVQEWGGQRPGHRACPPLSPFARSEVTFDFCLSRDPAVTSGQPCPSGWSCGAHGATTSWARITLWHGFACWTATLLNALCRWRVRDRNVWRRWPKDWSYGRSVFYVIMILVLDNMPTNIWLFRNISLHLSSWPIWIFFHNWFFSCFCW